MKKFLKETNHFYLRYVENKRLRSIRTYIKERENTETLSLRHKVIILKLHELFDAYKNEKIGLEKFLGISREEPKGFLDEETPCFKDYFSARGQGKLLEEAIEKVKKLKNVEEYNFLEALRRDKIEERLRDILWHVIPARKNIRYVFLKVKDDSESFYYIANKENFQDMLKFLDITDNSLNEKGIDFSLVLLKRKLKSMKIDINTLDEQHEKLQEELKPYYQLAEFYFFA